MGVTKTNHSIFCRITLKKILLGFVIYIIIVYSAWHIIHIRLFTDAIIENKSFKIFVEKQKIWISADRLNILSKTKGSITYNSIKWLLELRSEDTARVAFLDDSLLLVQTIFKEKNQITGTFITCLGYSVNTLLLSIGDVTGWEKGSIISESSKARIKQVQCPYEPDVFALQINYTNDVSWDEIYLTGCTKLKSSFINDSTLRLETTWVDSINRGVVHIILPNQPHGNPIFSIDTSNTLSQPNE